MVKALVIGDFHIPYRARRIPRAIWDEISSERFDAVLCPGDLTSRSLVDLLSRLGRVHVVAGNMDYLDLPRSLTVRLGGLKVGIDHGVAFPRGDVAQLSRIAERMGVDVLVSGHTHSLSVGEAEVRGKRVLLLNPGSACGTWSGGSASMVPSFIVLEIEGRRATVHAYELVKQLRRKTYIFEL
ncbi:TPA: YfcE family phosphodiesterase [Candidatus Bathyarchaeota archaeon]|nr:YfcE family phosphodiesterase [Candidatus Bathyarchaeota archaeon]